MTKTTKPPCPVCKGKVNGKANKDFCSVACKSKYHYVAELQAARLKDEDANKFVLRNYIVLLGIFRGIANKVIIHRNVLFKHGFHQFQYLENSKREGKPFKQILEFEFREIDGGLIEIYCNEHLPEYYAEFVDRWAIHFPDGFVLEKKDYGDKIERYFKIFCFSTCKKSTVKLYNNGERIEIGLPPD